MKTNWVRIERESINNPHLGSRTFHPRTRYREGEIIEAFGRSDPPSSDFLLHTFSPPDVLGAGTPILLVPGATRSAQYFLDPSDEPGSLSLPESLRRSGRMVYAITFAHSQDDNWGWCEAINEALLRLTQRHPGQPIDLLGHSKGGLAARLAVTDWRPDPICSRFLGELVGRVVLLGSPNEGLDYAFRYPACNLALLTNEEHPHLNWSVSWTNRLVEGTWQDCEELSYFATEPYQPGQRQMLARWDRQYPLPGKDPDESSTYEGGQGTRSSSLGIDIAIERGGDLIQQLKSRPTHPDVPVGLLAGARPTIKGFLNDTSIPGDGIIPIQSALGLPEASKVVAMATLPIDHIALITDPIAQAIVVEMLTIEPTALSPDQRLSALEEGLSIARSRSGL